MPLQGHRIDHSAAIMHTRVIQERNLARFDIYFDDRDVAHMAHDRIENAHMRVVLGRQRRNRVVIDISSVQAARQVQVLWQIEAEIMRLVGKLSDGQALLRRALQ